MAETAEKQTISIRVNGERRAVESECSIAAMLRAIGLDPLKIAVERNREIVPRSTFEATTVRDGDAFEIVHIVGGG
jgi:thiazole synthase